MSFKVTRAGVYSIIHSSVNVDGPDVSDHALFTASILRFGLTPPPGFVVQGDGNTIRIYVNEALRALHDVGPRVDDIPNVSRGCGALLLRPASHQAPGAARPTTPSWGCWKWTRLSTSPLVPARCCFQIARVLPLSSIPSVGGLLTGPTGWVVTDGLV